MTILMRYYPTRWRHPRVIYRDEDGRWRRPKEPWAINLSRELPDITPTIRWHQMPIKVRLTTPDIDVTVLDANVLVIA